jgi:hypothetical protein
LELRSRKTLEYKPVGAVGVAHWRRRPPIDD